MAILVVAKVDFMAKTAKKVSSSLLQKAIFAKNLSKKGKINFLPNFPLQENVVFPTCQKRVPGVQYVKRRAKVNDAKVAEERKTNANARGSKPLSFFALLVLPRLSVLRSVLLIERLEQT